MGAAHTGALASPHNLGHPEWGCLVTRAVDSFLHTVGLGCGGGRWDGAQPLRTLLSAGLLQAKQQAGCMGEAGEDTG